jgi:hypothetical protein
MMSALGHKRTFSKVSAMSALPPKADIAGRQLNVRFVPKADIALRLAPVRRSGETSRRASLPAS